MGLTPGSRLGAYEIVGLLGAGGMGEVYRAVDTRLDRQVALKILPEVVASDPERTARFQREAKVLATLNHPNIATIHGLEQNHSEQFIVMELVEGETLADRIARGPIPIDEALPIAKQIAEALEAAHEQAIVHRDLKPANIKVRPDGTVKVLDFGLAKALEPTARIPPGLTNSPTITSPVMTGVGILLGTADYMAPEQAKGRPADKRSDVWAFGCVLYEMLSGRRAFDGDDVAETSAAVLRAEPHWVALPIDTPQTVRELLEACLQKDRKTRISDMSTVRFLLARPQASSPSRSRHAGIAAVAATAASLSGAAVLAWAYMGRPATPPNTPTRFAIAPPVTEAPAFQSADRDISISPDGRLIAYRGGQGTPRLFVRPLADLDPRPLDGTSNLRAPFFSADSKSIGYWQGGTFYTIPASGGPPTPLCQLSGPPRGASWGDNNSILLATNDPATGLIRMSGGGGKPEVLTTPDPANRESDHQFPSFLPGSRAALFTIVAGEPDKAGVALLDLETRRYRMLITGGSQAEYVEPGYLLFGQGGSLRAVRFNLSRLQIVGDSIPVLEDVLMSETGAANYAVSRGGTLVYAAGAMRPFVRRTLVWADRLGRETPVGAEGRMYTSVKLSPDETQIAAETRDQENDIYIWDLKRPTALRRLTFDPSVDQQPVWTPDSKTIVFSSSRAGAPNLFRHAADGSGEDTRLIVSGNPQFASHIAADGRIVGYEVVATQYLTLFASSLLARAAPRDVSDEPGQVVRTTIPGLYPTLSPNGKFVAYMYSTPASGLFEVFVRAYPDLEGRWQISNGGGARPVWSRDGRELFFLDRRSPPALMGVAVDTSGPTLVYGPPSVVLERTYGQSGPAGGFDVAGDGRFLLIKEESTQPSAEKPSPRLVVFQNWFEELKRLVP